MEGITLDAGLTGIQTGLERATEASEAILDALESGDTDAAIVAISALKHEQAQVEASAKLIDADRKMTEYMLDVFA